MLPVRSNISKYTESKVAIIDAEKFGSSKNAELLTFQLCRQYSEVLGACFTSFIYKRFEDAKYVVYMFQNYMGQINGRHK